jgi:hypothetical protein
MGQFCSEVKIRYCTKIVHGFAVGREIIERMKNTIPPCSRSPRAGRTPCAGHTRQQWRRLRHTHRQTDRHTHTHITDTKCTHTMSLARVSPPGDCCNLVLATERERHRQPHITDTLCERECVYTLSIHTLSQPCATASSPAKSCHTRAHGMCAHGRSARPGGCMVGSWHFSPSHRAP